MLPKSHVTNPASRTIELVNDGVKCYGIHMTDYQFHAVNTPPLSKKL
jgi:hypothetical protein